MVMHLTTGRACQLRGVYPRFKMYHYWEVLDLQQVKYIFMCRRGKERNKSTYQCANALKTCEKPKQLWITDTKVHIMPKSHTDFVSCAHSGPSPFWVLISFHIKWGWDQDTKRWVFFEWFILVFGRQCIIYFIAYPVNVLGFLIG